MAVPSSVLTAINPLITTCQITAFFLFTINTKTWQAELRRFNYMIGLTSIVSIITLHYIYWFSYFGFDAHGTEMAKIFMPKLVYLNLSMLTIIKMWIFWNRQKVASMLKIIQEVDDQLKELNIIFDYQSERRIQIVVIIGSTAVILTCTTLGLFVQMGYMIDIDSSLSILNAFGFTSTFFLNFQVATGLVGIRQRFSAVNSFLRYNKEQDMTELKIITKIHLKLTEVIESFNFVYGPPTMLFTSICFGWCCLFIFLTVMMPLIMWTDYIFVSLFNILINSIIFILLYSLFYYAEKMKSEVKMLTKMLHEILNRTDSGIYIEQIMHMILQISNFKVEFSCGLVDFNWKFLFKVRLKFGGRCWWAFIHYFFLHWFKCFK